MSDKEIFSLIDSMGEPSYRTEQLIDWIYGRMSPSFINISCIPLKLRRELDSRFYLPELSVADIQSSRDGSVKLLLGLEDGEMIETVLMKGTSKGDNFTLCVSSQAGCAMGCLFCATGRVGIRRDLQASEIAEQVLTCRKYLSSPGSVPDSRILNIVFMGMGEPLNNLHEVSRAIHTLTGLMGFSKRKITLSTCGIVPGILKMAKDGPNVNLAVSLNATTDNIRNRIMPINRKYPLKSLMDACRRFPQSKFRRITFEYIMLHRLNDTADDANRLPDLLKGIKAKVNLISFNHLPDDMSSGMELEPSPHANIMAFQRMLKKAGIGVTIRRSKGADIAAACGQLKAGYR